MVGHHHPTKPDGLVDFVTSLSNPVHLAEKVDFMGERVTVELARGTPHGRDKERWGFVCNCQKGSQFTMGICSVKHHFQKPRLLQMGLYVFIGGATLHEEVVAVEAAAGITGDKPPPAKSELSYVLLLKG